MRANGPSLCQCTSSWHRLSLGVSKRGSSTTSVCVSTCLSVYIRGCGSVPVAESSVDSPQHHVARCIAAGGDQSFSVVDCRQPPVDMRHLKDEADILIPDDFAANRPLLLTQRLYEDVLRQEAATSASNLLSRKSHE